MTTQDILNQMNSFSLDPSAGRAAFNYTPGAMQYAQIDFVCTSTAANAANHIVELFNPGTSAIDTLQSDLGEAYTAAFDFATGDAVFTFAGPETCRVACRQVPYRAFFELLRTTPQQVGMIRYSVSVAAQFDEQINIREYSIFGGRISDSLSPRSYLNPMQNQNLVVDIPQPTVISTSKAYQIRLLAEESVTLSLFIPKFEKIAG